MKKDIVRNKGSALIFMGIVTFMLAMSFISCRKEVYYSAPGARLDFSVDTLFFDTVFTTLGSTTRSFTVYNPYKTTLKISEITLGSGAQSFFRLNVNGRSGNSFQNIELAGGDSMYVFAEVTVDPLNSNTPVFVHDSVVFIVNGNIQDLDLVAWGQDVKLFDGAIIGTQTWNAEKPYLIIHSMFVDTAQSLTILPGTKVYLFNQSTIYVGGTIEVLGTYEDPVTFQGVRLEKMYEDIPGQWGGIYILNGSQNNKIEHAVIQNGIFGIHLGNLFAEDPPPDMNINNTVIMHMTWAGISSIGATINGGNLLIADCGFYNLLLTAGGDYTFDHCTLANFWNWSNRTTPSLVLTDFYTLGDSVLITGDLTKAHFGNGIIYGNKDEEIQITMYDEAGEFRYYFDHCLVRTESFDLADTLHFNQVIVNHDPGFISSSEYDFHPDSLAFIRNLGKREIAMQWPLDLEGNSRLEDAGPDLGAFERIDSTALRQ